MSCRKPKRTPRGPGYEAHVDRLIPAYNPVREGRRPFFPTAGVQFLALDGDVQCLN
jgi:hypothetical protein